jgi:hypothetical protein
MLGLGACMGLRALGRVNLGKFLGAEKSTDKRIFKTVEKSEQIYLHKVFLSEQLLPKFEIIKTIFTIKYKTDARNGTKKHNKFNKFTN